MFSWLKEFAVFIYYLSPGYFILHRLTSHMLLTNNKQTLFLIMRYIINALSTAGINRQTRGMVESHSF